MDEPEWYTVQEVAARLRVAVQTVRNLIGRGDLPAIRVGRVYRIAAEDLEAFIRRQREREPDT